MDSLNRPSDLQFDSVTSLGLGSTAGTTPERLRCTACQTMLESEYYDVNGHSVCQACSRSLASHAEPPRGLGALARAAAFGVVAAILGAIVYFVVLAASGYEIGLIAIAIGYMVGYGIRLGTRGRGGRRFQILALALTYWAIGLAYSSLAIKDLIDHRSDNRTAASAPATAAGTTNARDVNQRDAEPGTPLAGGALVLGLLQLLVFTVVLPVIVIVGSLPGGLLSAAIIAFGMRQAWRMTAAPVLAVSGPYRIGSAPAAAG